MPPTTTAGTVPNKAAVTPESNSPNSFDTPTKSMFTAETRPHGIGRGELHKRRADIDADHVGCAKNRERKKRQVEVRGQTEDDRSQPEHHDRREHLVPGMARQRPPAQRQSCQRRADRGGAAQYAEPEWTRVQNIAREDGQQRRRTSQEDGKQIERDGPQNDGARTHERNSIPHALQCRGLLRLIFVAAAPARTRRADAGHRERNAAERVSGARTQHIKVPPTAGPAITAT